MISLTNVSTHSAHISLTGVINTLSSSKKYAKYALLHTATLSKHRQGRKLSDRVPFVVTFNPVLPNISHIISGNLNILHSLQRCKEALPSPPLISYRRYNNLRDMLVRAKHCRPSHKTPGAFRCNRSRCKTCPFNLLQ